MQSETIGALATALAKAQAAYPLIDKDKTVTVRHKAEKGGGSHTFKYATLGNILAKVRPVLAENELAFTQLPTQGERGMMLHSRLIHSSGEWIESVLLVAASGGWQQIGSAISYARRYAASAMLGICAEDDDDGESAPPPYRQERQQQQRQQPPREEENPEADVDPLDVRLGGGKHQGKTWRWLAEHDRQYLGMMKHMKNDDGTYKADEVTRQKAISALEWWKQTHPDDPQPETDTSEPGNDPEPDPDPPKGPADPQPPKEAPEPTESDPPPPSGEGAPSEPSSSTDAPEEPASQVVDTGPLMDELVLAGQAIDRVGEDLERWAKGKLSKHDDGEMASLHGPDFWHALQPGDFTHLTTMLRLAKQHTGPKS